MRRSRQTARPIVAAFPSQVSAAEHARAAAEIEDRLAALPEALAVYRIGGVSAPGVSDIDRVVVLERPTPGDPVWSSLSQRAREIAMHSPFAVDRETFRQHRWFSLLKPLELAGGEAEPLDPEPPCYAHLSRVLGVEGMIILLLNLSKQLLLGRIKARPMLCSLHALRHSLELCDLDRRDAPAAWTVVEETGEIRSTWPQMSQAQLGDRVGDLVRRAWPATIEALANVADPGSEAGVGSVPMGPPWSGVILEPTPSPSTREPSRLRGAWATARSRRASEARWRLGGRRLELPAGALAVLQPPSSPDALAARERRIEIVRDYVAFINTCGPGWSQIGFAQAFPVE